MKKTIKRVVAGLVLASASYAMACGNTAVINIAITRLGSRIPGLESVQRAQRHSTNVFGGYGAELIVFVRPVLLRMSTLQELTPEVKKEIYEPETLIALDSVTVYSINNKPYAYLAPLNTITYVPPFWKYRPPVGPYNKDGDPWPEAMSGVNGCVSAPPRFSLSPPLRRDRMIPLSLAFVDSHGDGVYDQVFKTDRALITPQWVTEVGGTSPFELGFHDDLANRYEIPLFSPALPVLEKQHAESPKKKRR